MTLVARLVLLTILTFLVASCGDGNEPGDSDRQVSTQPTTSPSSPPPIVRLTNSGTTLVGPAGGRARLNSALVTGYVDNATLNGESIEMSGWAAAMDLSGPARAVVAMSGKTSVDVTVPSRARPDLVDGYDKPGLSNAGFVVSIPISSIDCATPDQSLRIFGVVAKAAAALKWVGDVTKVIRQAC